MRTGDYMYVIADDERELGVFPARGRRAGRLARFLPGELPRTPTERKRHKPDLEALALLPGALLALESGSQAEAPGRRALGPRRARRACRRAARGSTSARCTTALDRDIPDLNIEGATVSGDRLLLFQRGNGRGAVNAVVALDLAAVHDLAPRGPHRRRQR